MTVRREDTCKAARAVEVVNAGPSLRDEAAAMTEDVNAAYYLVHQTVSRALAEPACGAISPEALSRELGERFNESAGDPPAAT